MSFLISFKLLLKYHFLFLMLFYLSWCRYLSDILVVHFLSCYKYTSMWCLLLYFLFRSLIFFRMMSRNYTYAHIYIKTCNTLKCIWLYITYNICTIIFIASNHCLTNNHLILNCFLFLSNKLTWALFLILFLSLTICVKCCFKCLNNTFIYSFFLLSSPVPKVQ